jgi:hypothetical protein
MSEAAHPHALQTPKVDLWAIVPLLLIVALRFSSDLTANASYFALAVYALFGRSHAIRALFLSWLFTMINPGLVPEASLTSVGRYAVMAAAAASAVLHSALISRDFNLRPFTLLTLALGIFFVCHSILFSQVVDVSILKATSWLVAAGCLVFCWQGLEPEARLRVETELYTGLVLILLVSLPFVTLPVGYLMNGFSFQGILNHPQVFGSTMALLGAWTIARFLAARRVALWLLVVAGLCVAAVFLTKARTAGLALIGGVGLSMIVGPILSRRSILDLAPGLRDPRTWVILGVLALAAVVFAPTIFGMVQEFVTKARTDVGGLFDLYLETRGRFIGRMVANVVQYPITGIGFGIASDPTSMIVDRSGPFGIPTGAPVEKGLVYLAVLEEVGVFGAAFVALWLLVLVVGAARGGLATLAVTLTILCTNISEATLFSPGGMGLLTLVLLGWAYSPSVSKG